MGGNRQTCDSFLEYVNVQMNLGAMVFCKDPNNKMMAILRGTDISGVGIVHKDPEVEILLKKRLKAEARYYENLTDGETWKDSYGEGWKDPN